jgi:hypothetical protein
MRQTGLTPGYVRRGPQPAPSCPSLPQPLGVSAKPQVVALLRASAQSSISWIITLLMICRCFSGSALQASMASRISPGSRVRVPPRSPTKSIFVTLTGSSADARRRARPRLSNEPKEREHRNKGHGAQGQFLGTNEVQEDICHGSEIATDRESVQAD